MEEYYEQVLHTIAMVYESQRDSLLAAGMCVANTLEADGLIHVFGCGHSHMVGEELFYRAGGLANVDVILDSSVMLHEGAVKSSRIERMPHIAPLLLERYQIEAGDVLLIVSNSGINAYPIDMALEGKARGMTVIGISSGAYMKECSKHPSRKHLSDICDINIDNCVDKGDASVRVTEEGQKAGPLSSISSFFIANEIILEACQVLRSRGFSPKLYQSGNLEGADQYNEKYVSQFRDRIKHL